MRPVIFHILFTLICQQQTKNWGIVYDRKLIENLAYFGYSRVSYRQHSESVAAGSAGLLYPFRRFRPLRFRERGYSAPVGAAAQDQTRPCIR